MGSVQQKVAAIKQKCVEVDAGARKIVSGIREQERVNRAAVAQINTGIQKVRVAIGAKGREIDAGARKIVSGIREQERVNRAAVAKQQANINGLVTTTKAYIKDFYFGQGKE